MKQPSATAKPTFSSVPPGHDDDAGEKLNEKFPLPVNDCPFDVPAPPSASAPAPACTSMMIWPGGIVPLGDPVLLPEPSKEKTTFPLCSSRMVLARGTVADAEPLK